MALTEIYLTFLWAIFLTVSNVLFLMVCQNCCGSSPRFYSRSLIIYDLYQWSWNQQKIRWQIICRWHNALLYCERSNNFSKRLKQWSWSYHEMGLSIQILWNKQLQLSFLAKKKKWFIHLCVCGEPCSQRGPSKALSRVVFLSENE